MGGAWLPWLLASGLGAGVSDPSAALDYLALGDSYTIGEGVAPAQRWPEQLAAALRAEGVALSPPRIVARTGWTTGELYQAMDEAALAPGYDLVSLLIGVNNQYRGLALDDYRVNFRALLERAIALAGGRTDRVFVLAIPDWGITPFALASGRDLGRIARELDAYNEAAATICRERGVAFVDIAPVVRDAGAQPAALAEDGLHPSGAMYARWTALALPVARAALGSPTR